MSYFICTDLISSLLDPRLVDPGLILINFGTYGPKGWKNKNLNGISILLENVQVLN